MNDISSRADKLVFTILTEDLWRDMCDAGLASLTFPADLPGVFIESDDYRFIPRFLPTELSVGTRTAAVEGHNQKILVKNRRYG